MEAEIQRLENKLYVSNPWPYFLWSFGAGDQEKGLHIATIKNTFMCKHGNVHVCRELWQCYDFKAAAAKD